MPPLPKGEALAFRSASLASCWRRSSPLLPRGEALAGRATSYWTPKARYGAKGRALLQRAAASGQAHLVKLLLAWTAEHYRSRDIVLCSSRRKLTDMPMAPPLGELAGASPTERASHLSQSRCTAISRLFVRAILSQCKSCLSASLPSPSLLRNATSPKGRGFGIPEGSKTPFRRLLLREGRGIWRSFKLSAYHRRKSNFVRVANFGSAGEVRTSPIRGTSPSWRTINIKLYIVYFIELRHLFYYSEGTNTIGYVHLAGEGSSSRLRLTW